MNQVQKIKTQITQSMSLNEGIDPFGVNVYASLSYKRVEKIVVALHLVTNKLPTDDSTRLAIRELGVQLLKDTLALKEGFQSAGTDAVNIVVSHIRLALSYVDLLNASGSLSDGNTQVFKNACARFVTFLNSAESARFAESLELTDEYFGGADTERNYEKNSVVVSKVSAEQDADVAQIATPTKTAPVQQQRREVVAPVVKSVATPHNLPESGERRGGILAVIDARGKATVKDIATVVTGCSEKTIQRELNAMIAEGVLRKVGERRWTTYFKS